MAHAEDLENPVIHKLHLTSRTDVATGQLVLEVSGCLTQASHRILLKWLHQLKRRLGDGTITVDVRGVRHLDPDVLLSLRRRAIPGGMDPIELRLAEPVELPICLSHVGPDGEVLAHLDGHQGRRRHAGISSPARPRTRTRAAVRKAARNSAGRPRAAVGLSSEMYDGTLDPEATVRALSGVALELLVDALYRHLDSPAPWFGAYTWYELASDELQSRRDKEERERPVSAEAMPAGGQVRRAAARGRR